MTEALSGEGGRASIRINRNRRPIFNDLPAVEPLPWRAVRAKDKELPDIRRATGGVIRGGDRCRALGLGRAMKACRQEAWPGSSYCYYHDKLQKDLTTPTTESYPVWPLPAGGYVLQDADLHTRLAEVA